MSFKSWSQTKGNVKKSTAQNENQKAQEETKPSAEPQNKSTETPVESTS